MGSLGDPEDEFTVLVTGFGPFQTAYPKNPSWEITSRLPAYLPRQEPSSSESQTTRPLPPVRIVTYPQPVRVNYQTVRSLVPTLWPAGSDHDNDNEPTPDQPPSSGGGHDNDDAPALTTTTTTMTKPFSPPRKVDLCIHIGMAGPRMYYSIEHRGHRDGYNGYDVDGEKLNDDDRRREEKDRWIWAGCPPELFTDLDVRDVLRRWRSHSPDDADLRISEDAGRYLCDFIYYSSLAHLYKRGENRRVVFLHVPCDASEKAIAEGRDLTVNLIRSMMESELSRRREADIGRGDKIAVKVQM